MTFFLLFFSRDVEATRIARAGGAVAAPCLPAISFDEGFAVRGVCLAAGNGDDRQRPNGNENWGMRKLV